MLELPVVCSLLLTLAAVAQDDRPRDVLRGTVTDAQGAPVEGVTVEVLRRDAHGFSCLDLEHARSTRKVQTLRTGRKGTFAGQLPRGVPFELRIDDGVHAPIWTRAVYAGEDIALQLVAPARVSIALHDENGKPWPGGTLELWTDYRVRWIAGVIDDQGRWQSERLPPGPMTIDIAPASARRPQWQQITIAAGVTTPIDLTLQPGSVLCGRVTDSATQKPIAGARIGEGWTMDKYVVTDADGRYEMRGYGASGYGEVRVTAAGHGPQLRRITAKGGAEDFQLEPACEVTGRVVDAAGRPVAGAYVAGVGGGFTGEWTHDWCSAETDADGRYRLVDMRAQVTHALMVRAEGFATLVGDMPSVGPTPHALPDVAMRPCRYVSGIVVDSAGQPLPGVAITMSGTNSDRASLLGNRDAVDMGILNHYIAQRETKTDSLGRIHFADVPPGSYQLTLYGDGTQESVNVEVVAGKDPEPVKIIQ